MWYPRCSRDEEKKDIQIAESLLHTSPFGNTGKKFVPNYNMTHANLTTLEVAKCLYELHEVELGFMMQEKMLGDVRENA